MVSNQDIMKFSNAESYKRGTMLYRSGYVEDLEVYHIGESDHVAAAVQGSRGGRYFTILELNHDTGELEMNFCDCPASYSYDGLCKHCVALYLAYLEYKAKNSRGNSQTSLTKIPGVRKEIKRQTSQALSELFRKESLKQSLPVIQRDVYGKVRLEPEFLFDGYSMQVDFKIGVSRMYVMMETND